MAPVIRKVSERDSVQLASMIRTVFVEHNAPKSGTVYSDPTTDDLFALFKRESAILWVAELNGRIAGCCGIYPTEGLPTGCAELVKFYLPKETRGLGIGRTLMEKSIQSAKAMGYFSIYIESLPEFSKAVGIYEKQGFKMLQNPLGNSGHTGCNIWMYKEL